MGKFSRGKRNGLFKFTAIFLVLAFILMISPVNAMALSVSDFASRLTVKEQTVMVFILDNDTYTVNGEMIKMDVSPSIVESRTMLPIRYAATPLGADVGWDDATRKVTVSLESTKLELWIGQSNALINGQSVAIDPDNANVKPLIINDRTMLPLRFVTEALGCDVDWDEVNRKVTITGSGSAIKPVLPVKPVIPPVTIGPGSLHSQDLSMIKNNWGVERTGQAYKVAVSEADLPIVQRIGRGYNVFDKYASALSLKNAVLDVSQLLQDQRVERIRFDHGEESHYASESIRSYSNSRSVCLGASGSYFGFGGSVNSSFDSSRTKTTSNYFATSSWVVKKYGVYVIGGTDFKKYLTADARKMINDTSVKPGAVFDTYGHYVLVDTITGGRLDYNVTATSEASTSFENFKTAARAGFNAIVVSASASGSYEKVTNKEAFDSDKDDNLVTHGGAFALNISQLQADPLARSKWESTLEDQGTLVDFGTTTTRALIPIWELCDDSIRAAALKKEFEELNTAEGNKWPLEKYLTGLYMNMGNDRDKVLFDCPIGYVMIDKDLNEGIHSDGKHGYYDPPNAYIFMGYQLDSNPDNAFTDFFLEFTDSPKGKETIKTSHNGNTANYTRWDVDLNWGTYDSMTKKKDPRYNYIYLWHTRDKTLPPIKEIKVVFDENPAAKYRGWQVVSWKNSNEAADANRQALTTSPVYIIVRR